MANIDDDNISNESLNETMEEVVAARLSRRGLLTASALTGMSALLASVPAAAKKAPKQLLGFGQTLYLKRLSLFGRVSHR